MKNLKNILLSATVIFVILIVDSCKKEIKLSCVDGNGDVIQEQRDLDSFKDLLTDGSFKTTIYQTQNSTVDLFAESNITPLITTEVTNQLLKISVASGQCYNATQAVEVYVNNPDYQTITANGSGSVNTGTLTLNSLTYNLNGSGDFNGFIDLDKIIFNLSGSGNATLVGTAGEGNLKLSGSGNIYATNFGQDKVYVTVIGSGDVHITVSSFLDVTISGSGNVYYKGNPTTINQHITGSGQLIDEN